ncbi:UDP-N-acetylmuramoyl-L-alanyl-D-glutamate--2,6-diaminopimelate ligase [Salinibius halmophilus]|uniref:UDP-N-acetylmuramoyl-L-alanyl-D-glutamate--2, 6-diaminopimelate ligase n=1 Tax=Salinibius halmophilus TaxID=1853216 RepID=UPI000E6699D1|nr:UDP-N-acetylmuramoyl-L-alanyl-D-glutamate--2,6-diaminopimelate ligase [Salinibius halmophilus]
MAKWAEMLGFPLEVEVKRLLADSRQVRPGDAFVALPGIERDGAEFVTAAVANGASLVISHQPVLADVPVWVVDNLVDKLPAVAAEFYQKPLSWLFGVTGTNGKTSVAAYVAQLLDEAGFLGTIGNGKWPNLNESSHTTQDLLAVHANLAELASNCQGVAMEVSSHAIDQQRIAALPFSVLAFTNLSRDHLDYHGSMDNYGACKKSLFSQYPQATAVVNIDDALGQEIAGERDVVTVSLQHKADHQFSDLILKPTGLQATWHFNGEARQVSAPLLGEFNANNLLVAMASAVALGVDSDVIVQRAANLVPVAGRMQGVTWQDRLAIVDYAHTPDALEKALKAARAHCHNKLMVVVGCGGDRDKGKRPLMAQAALEHADYCWFTSDNPRSENPKAILQDMEAGDPRSEARYVIDREQSIQQALMAMQPGDVLLVAGKGHEDYQEVQGQRYPFSDMAVIQEWWA